MDYLASMRCLTCPRKTSKLIQASPYDIKTVGCKVCRGAVRVSIPAHKQSCYTQVRIPYVIEVEVVPA
jgi:hypothetical protein